MDRDDSDHRTAWPSLYSLTVPSPLAAVPPRRVDLGDGRRADGAHGDSDGHGPHPTDTPGWWCEESYAWRFILDPGTHVGVCPTVSLGPIRRGRHGRRFHGPPLPRHATIAAAGSFGSPCPSPSAPALRALAFGRVAHTGAHDSLWCPHHTFLTHMCSTCRHLSLSLYPPVFLSLDGRGLHISGQGVGSVPTARGTREGFRPEGRTHPSP